MKLFEAGQKKSCQELLQDYQGRKEEKVRQETGLSTVDQLAATEQPAVEQCYSAEKLEFNGVDGCDVYNITAPFQSNGKTIIAGRVEERDSEDSVVIFFSKEDDQWLPDSTAPRLHLQDPFITMIDQQLVLGGVEIFPHPEIAGALGWRTLFYRGENINNLEKFAAGPDGMKDIRLIQLANGEIGIFTRPQGDIGGRGTIGFTKIADLGQLSSQVIADADLLENQFVSQEWGGANEIHLLKNGLLGVLGHIASFDQKENRHYYPMAFAFDPESRTASSMEIIACRQDFPEGPAKRADLVDVLFSGGLLRNTAENGRNKAILYVGVSDAEAHKMIIPDPFMKYER